MKNDEEEQNVEGEDAIEQPDKVMSPNEILIEETDIPIIEMPKSDKKTTKSEAAIFLTFSLMFMIYIFLTFDTTEHSQIQKAIRMELSGYDHPFDKIESKEAFLIWAHELVRYTQQPSYYDGRKRERNKDSDIAYSNYYISNIRFVQRRMKLIDGSHNNFFNFKPKIWASEGFEPNSATHSDEDTSAYGPKKMYKFSTKYNMNGFIIDINLFNGTQEENIKHYNETLESVKNNSWIDAQTRSILIDFVLYNPYCRVFTYFQATLVFSRSGRITTDIRLFNINETYYSQGSLDIFRAICEVIFLILLLMYIVQQPFFIYNTYKTVAEQFEDEDTIKKAVDKKTGRAEESKTVGQYVWDKLILIITVIYTHFSDLWNILDLIGIMLSTIEVIIWLEFIYFYSQYSVPINDLATVTSDTNDKFWYFSQMVHIAKGISAYNCIIVFIRVLKYLGVMIKRVTVLFDTLNKAKSDILHFIVIIFMVMIAYMLFCYIFFGTYSVNFSSFTMVFVALFEFMNWWYAPLDDMLEINMTIACVMFVSFMIVVNMVFLNMFVGFLLKGYRDADKELQLQIRGYDINSGKKIHYDIEVHWINYLRNVAIGVLALFFAKYKNMKIEEEKLRENHLRRLIELKDESMDFDRECNPITVSQDKSRIPLTSHFIEETLNIERERRYGRVFFSALVFFGFVAAYILVLMFQLNVYRSFYLTSSTYNGFIGDVIFESPPDTKRFVTYNGISDMEYFSNWLTGGLPMLTLNLGPDVNPYHFIIGGELRITFRQGKKLNGTTQMQKMFERLSSESMLWSSKHPAERTETIVGNNSVYRYSHGGYTNKGGYVVYLNISKADNVTSTISKVLTEQMKNLTFDGILGPDTWIFTVEFVSYYASLDYYVYSCAVLKFWQSGQISKDFSAFPVTLEHYSTSEHNFRTFGEVIFWLFFLYYLISYVNDFRYKWIEYNDWFEGEIFYFRPLQLYQRSQKAPEWWRRFKFILTMFRILDLLSFIMTIVAFSYWIAYNVSCSEVLKHMPCQEGCTQGGYDFYENFRNLADMFSNYINYSSISLIIAALRTVEYLQYAGNMQIITKTISDAQEDIFYFLIIFTSLMMGFCGMVNIIFGEYAASFDTIGESWASCFLMLMGEFDLTDLFEYDLTTAAVFIFFFMVLFSHILINIFFAILEINFSNSKEALDRLDDRVRVLNILCCCFLPKDVGNKSGENSDSGKLYVKDYIAKLEDFNIRVDSIPQSLRWWTNDLSNQILSDHMRRQFLRKLYQRSQIAVAVENTREENNPNFLYSNNMRKNFLQYLRIAAQLVSFQRQNLDKKITSVDKEIILNEQTYFSNRRQYFILQLANASVSQELKKEMRILTSGGSPKEKRKDIDKRNSERDGLLSKGTSLDIESPISSSRKIKENKEEGIESDFEKDGENRHIVKISKQSEEDYKNLFKISEMPEDTPRGVEIMDEEAKKFKLLPSSEERIPDRFKDISRIEQDRNVLEDPNSNNIKNEIQKGEAPERAKKSESYKGTEKSAEGPGNFRGTEKSGDGPGFFKGTERSDDVPGLVKNTERSVEAPSLFRHTAQRSEENKDLPEVLVSPRFCDPENEQKQPEENKKEEIKEEIHKIEEQKVESHEEKEESTDRHTFKPTEKYEIDSNKLIFGESNPENPAEDKGESTERERLFEWKEETGRKLIESLNNENGVENPAPVIVNKEKEEEEEEENARSMELDEKGGSIQNEDKKEEVKTQNSAKNGDEAEDKKEKENIEKKENNQEKDKEEDKEEDEENMKSFEGEEGKYNVLSDKVSQSKEKESSQAQEVLEEENNRLNFRNDDGKGIHLLSNESPNNKS